MPTTDLKRLMNDPELWLRQATAYYRDFGLLHVSEDEAKAALLRAWDAIIPSEARNNPQFADMFLLAEGRGPVWWNDLEQVYPNANSYVETLTEWAAISRGAFAPEDIHEEWTAAGTSAEVTFRHDNRQHRFTHSERSGDFTDMDIVKLINSLIRQTLYQFEIADMGMPNFVLALDRAEKARLKQERGWVFEDAISGSSH